MSHDTTPPAPGSTQSPYRRAEPPTGERIRARRSRRAGIALAGIATAAAFALVGRALRHRPRETEVPPAWRDDLRRLVVPGTLPPAVPLAPLLAADAPEGLAMLEPQEGASRISRGDSLRIRFNRPMVPGARVGRALVAVPLRFTPALRGTARWTSRSTLVFEPEAEEWTRTHEVSLSVDPALASLAGERVGEQSERTIVLDATPRLSPGDSPRRVTAGEPLRLAFDGPVDPATLAHELMAYEIGGGGRSVSFSLARGRHEETRNWIDVRLARALEPGARIALVAAPMLLGGDGESPERMDFEFAPRPMFEGIDCGRDATSASQCEYTGAPGRVVDIEDTLRLRASVALTPGSAHVTVQPVLPAMTVETSGETLAIHGEWAPGQVYEVRVEDARTTTGDALAHLAPLAVRSAGIAPAVEVTAGRLSFERDDTAALRVTAVHVDRGEVRYLAVRPGEEFPAVLVPDALRSSAQPRAVVSPLAPLVPDARANRWARGSFAWLSPEAGRTSNMAMVEFRASPESGSALAFVQRTDLGITARLLDRGALVWVTSLATGQPVAGAEVAVGQAAQGAIASARTDGDGVAWLDLPAAVRDADQTLAVRASAGDDRAVMVLDPRTAIRPGNFGLAQGAAAPPTAAPVATVFADRGAYRSGDTLHIALVARVPGQGATLRALRRGDVELRLVAPGDPVALVQTRAALSAFGTAAADLVLPASLAVGEYELQASVAGTTNPIGTTSIRVAEYRDPAMRVDVATDVRDAVDGDPLHAHLAASFLFGAPAAGATMRWTLTREPDATYPARWEPYSFARDGIASRAGTVDSGEGVLDERGSADVATTVRQSAAMRERETLEVEVQDAAGQVTSARRSIVTYPAGYEVGLRRGPAWVPSGTALDIDAVVIAHDGTPAAGRAVEARVIREGWGSYWEWVAHVHDDGAGAEGGYRARRVRQSEQVQRCALTSGDQPVHCTFAPDRPGAYLLEVETRDDAGRSAIASRRVYVTGPGDRPNRDEPGAAVTLTPERSALAVGAQARIAFESPFPDAEALVTVERDGVLHTERRRVHGGGNVIEFATTEAMVPNAFVALTLVRPRTAPPADGVDPGAPDLRLGETELTVRPHARPIAVALTVPTGSVRPDQDVTVQAELRGDDGRPVRGEVTLYAVDEGTLRLTGYSAPDATAGLYPRRAPSFAIEDLRRSLSSREAPTATLPGGDGGESSSRSVRDERERFDPTPLWRAHLITDAHGRVRAVFHLPNRSTEYRVMAVAVDDGAGSGRASTSLVAHRDVVLRPAFPRFVTEGDRFEASVFVHNAGEQPVDATVVPEIAGAPLASWTLHLAPGGEQRVSVPVEARGNSLAIRFHVAGDGGDTVAATVPVLARAHNEHSLVAGSVTSATDLTVSLPAGTIARDGQVTLELSNQPFVGGAAAVASIDTSIVAGTSAAASTLLAAALWRDSASDQRAARALERLESLQAADGSFGHWSNDEAGDPHAAAFAVHALETARIHGVIVPSAMREKSLAWLTQFLSNASLAGLDEAARDAQALALRALAEAGRPDNAHTAELYERRESLSAFATAQLGLALEPRDLRRITLALRVGRLLAAPGPSVDARALAAGLEIVAQTEGASVYCRPIASLLLSNRRAGEAGWDDAESTATALEALATYATRFADAGPLRASVTLDGQVLTPVATDAQHARYTLPFERVMQGEHRVHLETTGTAFYALAGRWGVALGTEDTIARGARVALHRVLETSAGAPLADGAHVRLGDTVRVRLFMYAEQEPPADVTVLDRTGGGFEPIDRGLDTSPQGSLDALLGAGIDDEEAVDPRGFYAQRSLGLITYRAFGTSETAFCLARADAGLREFTYGVRATTVGTFILPPAELSAERDVSYVARGTSITLTVDP